MDKSFSSIANDPRPIDAMSHLQIGLVLGLDKVLREAGLVLTCPRCAAEGHPTLDTNNSMTDDVWKIDCLCRRRRGKKTDTMMVPSGWLLQLKDDLLGPLHLDVRCPRRSCILTPLTIHESLDRAKLTVTCSCGNTFDFTKPRSKPN